MCAGHDLEEILHEPGRQNLQHQDGVWVEAQTLREQNKFSKTLAAAKVAVLPLVLLNFALVVVEVVLLSLAVVVVSVLLSMVS